MNQPLFRYHQGMDYNRVEEKMKNGRMLELAVGFFLLAGFGAFVYLSLQLGEFSPFALQKQYRVVAAFDSISGLKKGAAVEIAGVPVGQVASITLDADKMAQVTMLIDRSVSLASDSIASIKTQGIIGDKYVNLTPGGAGDALADNESLLETESAVDLEALVSKYIFGGV